MTCSVFNNVKIISIKTVIPENFIDIDDELEFFDNNPKKLARARKMAGYGRRYLLDDGSTVTDMCVDAAEKLINETGLIRDDIDLLIFVNQKPDYKEPCDACVAHGRLNLSKKCATLDLSHGCSGYPHALWTAHALIASGAVRNCLLLAGDVPSRSINPKNRKIAQIFGDAASATFLERTSDTRAAYFLLGTDGQGWDKIVIPFGGSRLPIRKDVIDLELVDKDGNVWTIEQSLMQGEDVFSFSAEVGPKIIREVIEYANMDMNSVEFFAIHQANKQIVDNIIAKAQIPAEKTTTETFTKYANNSTNSVVTVLCDQLKDRSLKHVLMCTFGIGLSWGACIVDWSGVCNGGISTYYPPKDRLTRQEQIEYWSSRFLGEQK